MLINIPRQSWRWLAVLLATVGVLLAPTAQGVASAAHSPKLVVSSISGQPNAGLPTLWSGTLRSDEPRRPEVPQCESVACDAYRVKVKLPENLWQRRSGGVQFAIRYINGTPDDSLGLVVYDRHHNRVAASTATVGTAQAVRLPSAANGVYSVYVVSQVAFGSPGPSPAVAYEALAQVMYDRARCSGPGGTCRPDLVALPQQNVTFGPPPEIFDDPVPEGSTCHQSEIDKGAQLCLRFDQVLGNTGQGPLEIQFSVPTGLVPTEGQEFPAVQRIYRPNGAFTDVPTGTVEWHGIHRHFHFKGFAQSELWAVDAHGNRTGSAPVATGAKVSFCIADTNVHPAYWGQRAFGPTLYPAPACLERHAQSNGMDLYNQGLVEGGADSYPFILPGQYIEVTGVPNGVYILDTTVDPTGRLREIRTNNNCSAVRIVLTNMTATIPQAELLGAGPACNA